MTAIGSDALRIALIASFVCALPIARAQDGDSSEAARGDSAGARGVQVASIHWQSVPLGDAVGRLQKLFDDTVFVDRRVDPQKRISVDVDAASVEEVFAPIAEAHGWDVGRIGDVVYLGPAGSAAQLESASAARMEEVAKLPRSSRLTFRQKRELSWPRLSEPRKLIADLIERNDWRVEGEEQIPHDLWAADRLRRLSLADQLTLLLFGFDLTYEIRPEEQTVRIVALKKLPGVARDARLPNRAKTQSRAPLTGGTKQVFSLRVAEKPVGAVVRELARQLKWQIEFDEAAIRVAGRSLETRVSFAVENAEQDELLNAVLEPAGLTFRRDGERIIVVPR